MFFKNFRKKLKERKKAIAYIIAHSHLDEALEYVGLGPKNYGLLNKTLSVLFGKEEMLKSKLEELNYEQLMTKYEMFFNYINKPQAENTGSIEKKEENILKRDIILANLTENEKVERYKMIELIWEKASHSIKKEYETKLDLEIEENFKIKALFSIVKEEIK